MPGFIISAPSSGAGKTTITLGILRALARRGLDVRGAKSGPDYIDPRFHEAACGNPCLNLDAWAMSPDRIRMLAASTGVLVVEGAMGLFDGAPPDGRGATADLARILGLPVVLVVDAARIAQSVAPLVNGFANHDPNVQIAGVLLNRVGSERHESMLRRALNIPVFGAIRRDGAISHPSRHLGLVQANERTDLDPFLDKVADLVEATVDLDALLGLATSMPKADRAQRLRPPAQKIAIAQDEAFAFAYPHILQDWHAAGAEISFFSPLADEGPQDADFVFLPGGYPELHAGRLAANLNFKERIRRAAQASVIYGECGGYMVLGKGLVDAGGQRHEMLGLLNLETSFAARKMHLGYRKLQALGGAFDGEYNGHEFHFASTMHAKGTPLFKAWDAEGTKLNDMGLQNGRVSGSFAHIIDQAS